MCKVLLLLGSRFFSKRLLKSKMFSSSFINTSPLQISGERAGAIVISLFPRIVDDLLASGDFVI